MPRINAKTGLPVEGSAEDLARKREGPEQANSGPSQPHQAVSPAKRPSGTNRTESSGRPQDEGVDVTSHAPFAMSDTPPKPAPKVVQRYTYNDENGNPLRQVRRWEPGLDGKSKSFRQHSWDGSGWKLGVKGVRDVLYRLPQVIAAVEAGQPIIICEGEKDADKLVELGIESQWVERRERTRDRSRPIRPGTANPNVGPNKMLDSP